VHSVGVKGFTNAGIHIQAHELPHTIVNHWQLYNAAVSSCGLGVVVMGSDSQGGTAVGLELTGNGYDLSGQILPRGNGGTAVYDRGNAPNNWIGCATEANTGRAFVAATSNVASTVLGYIEARQQPSYLGIAAFKINAQADDSPDSTGWIVNGSQAVGPFVIPNTKDNRLKLWLGYKSNDPTILYAWQNESEAWIFRWDEGHQMWRTESLGAVSRPRATSPELRTRAALSCRGSRQYCWVTRRRRCKHRSRLTPSPVSRHGPASLVTSLCTRSPFRIYSS
jgi:hypothetical protein